MPRFRIRTLMVVVAVVALVLFSAVEARRLYRLRKEYQRKVFMHRTLEEVFRGSASIIRTAAAKAEDRAVRIRRGEVDEYQKVSDRIRAELKLEREDLSEFVKRNPETANTWAVSFEKFAKEERASADHEGVKADYHACLREKYERAARYPWLPVEPDPPEPE